MRSAIRCGENPILINIDTWECRYGIIMTNRKSLIFQGDPAFVIVHSISFPDLKDDKKSSNKGECLINDKK